MIRGINFEIPNEYGRFLELILKPINLSSYNWFIGGEESYLIGDGGSMDPLFPDMVYGMNGEQLRDKIENNLYYLIFANLKAFLIDGEIREINTYDEYRESDCQLILLVIDSSYIAIYCKEQELLKRLYENAKNNNFENLQYVTDDNDTRTRLSVW